MHQNRFRLVLRHRPISKKGDLLLREWVGAGRGRGRREERRQGKKERGGEGKVVDGLLSDESLIFP